MLKKVCGVGLPASTLIICARHDKKEAETLLGYSEGNEDV